jgi:spore germination protein YaaH
MFIINSLKKMGIKLLILTCLALLAIIFNMEYGVLGSKIISRSRLFDPAKKLNIIGWIPYWDQKNAFSSFSKNTQLFDYISVFWFQIAKNGSILPYDKTKIDTNIISFAHAHNVKILALVANLSSENGESNWDYQRIDSLINSPKTRRRHIAELLNLVKYYNFDGIDIDYENLKSYQRENFSLFIEELAV